MATTTTAPQAEVPKTSWLDKIKGWRKLLVFSIAFALLLLNHKLQLGLDNEVEKWLSALVASYMLGNGLEHMSEKPTVDDSVKTSVGTIYQGPMSEPSD